MKKINNSTKNTDNSKNSNEAEKSLEKNLVDKIEKIDKIDKIENIETAKTENSDASKKAQNEKAAAAVSDNKKDLTDSTDSMDSDEAVPESKKRKFSVGKVFEGPLDLLWSLISENKININDIPISEITDQFLDYLDYAVELDLHDLSDFYLWAAKLCSIKSRMLLPVEVRLNDGEGMEDPRAELVEQLIEYQRFKKLSMLMEEREEQSEWSFERKKIERTLPFGDDESQWQKMDTWALLEDMQKIFRNITNVNPDGYVIEKDLEIAPNEKITLMQELLDKKGACMFTELITRKGNELDVICAFMAILEAVKLKMADIYQNKMFGDIKICKKVAA